MIQIVCKYEKAVYHAYHMVQAFFPSAKISCRVEEEASHYVGIWIEGQEGIFLPEEKQEDRSDREGKQHMERVLYDALSGYTGKTLAWGKLSGVRPTKLAMKKMEEGLTQEEFLEWFYKTHRVSRQKGELAWEISKREKGILEKLAQKDGYSLYVGIPFCPTVCSYCSFGSGTWAQWEKRSDDYVEALCRELEFIGKACRGKRLNTIYIGGGTPTSLHPHQLEKVLSAIDRQFSKKDLLEYTVEAGRPDSITEEKLRIIKNHQVTRISINPQTMQQKTLDLVGRKHTVGQVEEVFYQARKEGFDNINMDLILGLPKEEPEDVEDTLRRIRELGPDSLTVHSLAIKRAARMEGQDFGEGEEKFAGKMEKMTEISREAARRMDLLPYYLYRQKNIAGNFENVGYAKVDKAGIYNILIMEERQSIVAAGAGATTKILLKEAVEKKGKMTNLIRIDNMKAIDAYIRHLEDMLERKGEWL